MLISSYFFITNRSENQYGNYCNKIFLILLVRRMNEILDKVIPGQKI